MVTHPLTLSLVEEENGLQFSIITSKRLQTVYTSRAYHITRQLVAFGSRNETTGIHKRRLLNGESLARDVKKI